MRKSLNHPLLCFFGLVRATDDVTAHVANHENCSIANSGPLFAHFIGVKLSTCEDCNILFSQADRPTNASTIGILSSCSSFCFNDIFEHGTLHPLEAGG